MPPEGGVHEKPNDKCTKMCGRYVESAIWRRSVKQKSEKTYMGKTTEGGGCSNSTLGCINVNMRITKYTLLTTNRILKKIRVNPLEWFHNQPEIVPLADKSNR